MKPRRKQDTKEAPTTHFATKCHTFVTLFAKRGRGTHIFLPQKVFGTHFAL